MWLGALSSAIAVGGAFAVARHSASTSAPVARAEASPQSASPIPRASVTPALMRQPPQRTEPEAAHADLALEAPEPATAPRADERPQRGLLASMPRREQADARPQRGLLASTPRREQADARSSEGPTPAPTTLSASASREEQAEEELAAEELAEEELAEEELASPANDPSSLELDDPTPEPAAVLLSTTPTPRATPTSGWRERFLDLVAAGRRARGAAREPIVADLARVVAESDEACPGFAQVEEALSFYADHARLLRRYSALTDALEPLQRRYFEGALARASGPASFAALDAWCDAQAREAWRAELAPYLALARAPATDAQRRRERARREREQARAAVEGFAAEQREELTEALEGLLAWMARSRYAPPAARARVEQVITRGLGDGAPAAAARLRDALDAIEHDPAQDRLVRAFTSRLERALRKVVPRLLKAVDTCLDAGEPGLGYDLFKTVLQLDPENDRAHKGLGHVKVDGRWLRRFEAERLRQGQAWDPALGWVRAGDEARYAGGEVYDWARETWSTRAEADAFHRDPSRPWVIETEHFRLRSTASLTRAVAVAERLEAFYLALFRQFDLFFAGDDAARLIFGLGGQAQPLEVRFYRDEAQYRAHGDGPQGAAGHYDPATGAAAFYDDGDDFDVLQHELAHQILGEASKGSAPAWVAEGVAVYLQYARFTDGAFALADIEQNPRVRRYGRELAQGSELTFAQAIALVDQGRWNDDLSDTNYRAAGAAVFFLMRCDDARYRGDFVEFVRDAYAGLDPRLEDYLGLPIETLGALASHFYAGRVPAGR